MRLSPLPAALIVALGLLAAAPPAKADPASDRHVLEAELARLTADPKAGSITVPDGRTIHPGEHNAAIPAIRGAVAAYGFDEPDASHPEGAQPIDPQLYDDHLAGEMRRFQDAVGLVPDAQIGMLTRKAMRAMDADRVLMLQQSLDQPTLPSKGRFVAVNLAAAMLTAYEDGKPVLRSAIVIGRKDSQTPIMSARIDAVWLNPSWIVPDSIVQKEFGGNAHIEKPGPNNPLGQLLLEMPNKDEIFIHSTNQPSLFEWDQRAFSHGCVRVKEIEALARWVLGEDRWASEGMDAGLGRLASRRLALDQTIPVYIRYSTATVGPGDHVIYHPDPYGLAAPPPPPPTAESGPTDGSFVATATTAAHTAPN